MPARLLQNRPLRYTLITLAGIALLLGAYFGALHLARAKLVSALGETGTVGEIRATLTGIEIDQLRVKASQRGWPGPDELSAARVRIRPDLRMLFAGELIISSIRIEDASLTVLRNRQGIHILPALLGAKKPAAGKNEAAAPESPDNGGIAVRIGRIELADSRIDFHDVTLAKPQRILLDQLALSLEDLNLPAMKERSALQMQARVASRGKLALDGWLVPADLGSDLRLTLDDVPLKVVEPYLFKQQIGEVKAGRLALKLDVRVENRRLKAPGHMRLSNVELGGIVGLTREASAAFARSRGIDADTSRPVDMDFTLQGNLDDGSFSLNDAIYRQAGQAALKLIGIGSSDNGSSKSGGSLSDRIKGLFN